MERYTLKPYKTHNRNAIIKEINKTWNDCNNHDEATKIAKTFFKTKISGRGTDWFPFSLGIQESKENLITKRFHNYISTDRNKIISYFTSSEDEFESLGDIWLDKRFKLSQKETIKELSRIAIKNNILLIIRVHPNFHNSSKESKKIWSNIFNDLPKKNTLIIKEKDEFSSYKVIKNSDIVIVYGSTIGIEATFLEKPLIITGSSFYFGTKAKIYPVFTLKDLEKNIDNLLLSFDNNQENQRFIRESSYPYGYWAYTHGFKYKYFSPITPNKGYFLKQDLQKLHRILSFFKKIFKGLILSK